jgi:hypothetical protein
MRTSKGGRKTNPKKKKKKKKGKEGEDGGILISLNVFLVIIINQKTNNNLQVSKSNLI